MLTQKENDDLSARLTTNTDVSKQIFDTSVDMSHGELDVEQRKKDIEYI